MSEAHPLVTIAIPTYNRAEATLADALESALAQDYEPVEIVVSDNASVDATEELVRSYQDERIRYIKQPRNLGPTGNYNACLDSARGDYFLLLHDDDLIDPDFVSRCMERAGHSSRFGLILAGTRMIRGDGSVIKVTENRLREDTAKALYRGWIQAEVSFYLCSTLFNTEALREVGGWRSRNNLFEDGMAIIRIVRKWPFLNIREAAASCRNHPDQRTHSALVRNWCEDFREAIDLIAVSVDGDGEQLYEEGMRRFSRVGLSFARRVRNPARRALAVLGVSKSFPVRYWPQETWRMRLIGRLGGLVYPERKPALPQERMGTPAAPAR